MSELTVLTSAAWMCLFGVMSPGPSFVAITSKSLVAKRKQLFWLTTGIALINGLWAACALFGLKALMTQFPILLRAIQIFGAAYLAWFGYRLIRSSITRGNVESSNEVDTRSSNDLSTSFFKQGIFTNLSNPKSLLFYSSVFSVAIPEGTDTRVLLELIVVVFVVSLSWYASLAFMLTTPTIQTAFSRLQNIITKTCGLALIVFAGLQL